MNSFNFDREHLPVDPYIAGWAIIRRADEDTDRIETTRENTNFTVELKFRPMKSIKFNGTTKYCENLGTGSNTVPT